MTESRTELLEAAFEAACRLRDCQTSGRTSDEPGALVDLDMALVAVDPLRDWRTWPLKQIGQNEFVLVRPTNADLNSQSGLLKFRGQNLNSGGAHGSGSPDSDPSRESEPT